MGYRLLLLGLLITAVGYTVAARLVPMDAWTAAETVNAQTLPTVYGIALSVALLVLLVRRGPSPPRPSGYLVLRVVGVCLLILCFVAAVEWLSLWFALGGLLLSASWWLGERRWPALVGLTSGVPLTGYIGIELVLGVYLPG